MAVNFFASFPMYFTHVASPSRVIFIVKNAVKKRARGTLFDWSWGVLPGYYRGTKGGPW